MLKLFTDSILMTELITFLLMNINIQAILRVNAK